ncbi:MAG: hypothetical protein ACRC31_02630, partial [Cetobacterium sp.]
MDKSQYLNPQAQNFINNFNIIIKTYQNISKHIRDNNIDIIDELSEEEIQTFLNIENILTQDNIEYILNANLSTEDARRFEKLITIESKNMMIQKLKSILKPKEIQSTNTGLIIPIEYNIKTPEEIKKNIDTIKKEFVKMNVDYDLSQSIIKELQNKYKDLNKEIPIIPYWNLISYLKKLKNKEETELENKGIFILEQKQEIEINYTNTYKEISNKSTNKIVSNYSIFVFTKNIKKGGSIGNEIFKMSSIFEKRHEKKIERCIEQLKDIQDLSMKLSIILEGIRSTDESFIYNNTLNPFDNSIKVMHLSDQMPKNTDVEISKMFGVANQQNIDDFKHFFNSIIQKHGKSKIVNNIKYIESSFSDIIFIMVNDNILMDSPQYLNSNTWKVFLNNKTKNLIEYEIETVFNKTSFIKDYKNKTKKSTDPIKNIIQN